MSNLFVPSREDGSSAATRLMSWVCPVSRPALLLLLFGEAQVHV